MDAGLRRRTFTLAAGCGLNTLGTLAIGVVRLLLVPLLRVLRRLLVFDLHGGCVG